MNTKIVLGPALVAILLTAPTASRAEPGGVKLASFFCDLRCQASLGWPLPSELQPTARAPAERTGQDDTAPTSPTHKRTFPRPKSTAQKVRWPKPAKSVHVGTVQRPTPAPARAATAVLLLPPIRPVPTAATYTGRTPSDLGAELRNRPSLLPISIYAVRHPIPTGDSVSPDAEACYFQSAEAALERHRTKIAALGDDELVVAEARKALRDYEDSVAALGAQLGRFVTEFVRCPIDAIDRP